MYLLRLCITFLLFSIASLSWSQTKKYHRNVTNNSENEIAPYLSMDGNTLIYTRKRAMDDGWKTQISEKVNGTWKRPQNFDILNELPKSRLLGSYSTNRKADKVLFTSKRYGGIGSYDIWITSNNGNTWSKPINLGKPINSKLEEVNAIFSLDEKSIYFIRRAVGEENGEIYNSKKKGNEFWNTPTKTNISGKYFAIRIASDNLTMYLSKIVGEKTELYVSRLENKTWSTPLLMPEYSSSADKYFTLSVQSTNLTISDKLDETYDFYKLKIDSEHRSTPVTELTINCPQLHNVNIQNSTNKKILSGNDIENYYLLNNDTYTLSILFKDYFPIINEINLTNRKYKNIVLSPKPIALKSGNSYELSIFNKDSNNVESPLLKNQLATLTKITKNNPRLNFEIVYYQNNISIQDVKSDEFYIEIKDSIPPTDEMSDSTKGNLYKERIRYTNDNTNEILGKIKNIEPNFLENVTYKTSVNDLLYKKTKGLYVIIK